MDNTELTVSEMQNAAALTAQNLTFEKAQILEQVGAIKMAALTRKFVSVSKIELLTNIKKNKQYKDLPMTVNGKSVFVTTFEQFCNAIGSSVETVDNNIRNYQRLGVEFFEYAQNAGIPQRALGQIGRLPEADRQAVIEMAQQEDTTKEAVLEVLEQVMAKSAAEKEKTAVEKAELEGRLKEAEESLEAKDRVLADKAKQNDTLHEQVERLRRRQAQAKPADVAEDLKLQLASTTVGIESQISRFRELFAALAANAEASGQDHAPMMVGSLNQIIRDCEALREQFALPQEAPTNARPEWLDAE